MTKSFGAVALGACLLGMSVARAEDYNLPAGETDTISTSVNYTTMNIAGNLTVSDGALVTMSVGSAINVIGGTATVSGKTSRLGTYSKSGTMPMTITNNADGVVGKLVLDASGSSVYNIGSRPLNICLDEEVVQSADGYVDIMEMRGGWVQFFNTYNYSTLTARVTVVGANRWAKADGYCYGAGIFQKGAFLFDLQNDASLRFLASNQQAGFNEAGVVVRTVGTGTVLLDSQYNSWPMKVCRGASFNHSGKIRLKDSGRVEFQTGDAIGPNVTRIEVESGTPMINVARGVTARIPCDVALSPTAQSLGGWGTLEMDCSEKPLSLAAMSGAYVTLLKTGSEELTVNSSLMANVRVQEGTLRFVTRNCTVRDVRVEAGAEIVVDGVTLTLDMDSGRAFKCLRDAVIRTVNGGKIVSAVPEGTTEYLFDSALEGAVNVQSGTLAASASQGDTRKYWRFVFKGTATSPGPLLLRQLYLFDKDNHIQNWGMSQVTPAVRDDEWTALAANKARWRLSSATNLVNATANSWQNYNSMGYIFTASNAGNNYAYLKAPVLNVEDTDSYLTVELRLKDTAAPVTGYTLGFADKTKYANTWNVYASADGADWELVDTQAGAVPYTVPDTYFAWDGSDYEKQLRGKTQAQVEAWLVQTFRLAGTKVDGLAATGPIQAQVDAGATLDLTAYTEAAQVIDGLTVSTAAASGTIKGGELAAAGTVSVDAFDYENPPEPIALDLDGVDGLARLANWTVACGGLPQTGVAVSYDVEARKLTLEKTANYLHIQASGEGDLSPYLADKDLVVKIDAGVYYTNTTALVGAHGLAIDASGTGRLVQTAASESYTGTIALNSGTLFGPVANAFGTGTIEIAGSTTELCRLMLGSSTVATSYANDIVLKGPSSSSFPAIYLVTGGQKAITVNGDITACGDLYIKDAGVSNNQNENVVYFKGAVRAEGYRIDYPCDNNVRWQGQVVCKDFYCWATYPQMGSHFFYSSENRIEKITCLYNSIRAAGEGVLGGAAWVFPNGYGTEVNRGALWLSGYSQTLASLNGIPSNIGISIDYNVNNVSTLTLTGGVATATASVALGRPGASRLGNISLVVDAGNDDFTQTLTNSVGTTYGTVTVKNGTLRLAGASSLTNVPSLTVTGGCLDIDTTVAEAFGKVTGVTLGDGATLRVGAEAATPFGATPTTVLAMETTSVLDLPEGAAVTVNKATVGGEKVVAGTYTGAEGAESGLPVLSQIAGKGVLTVKRGGGMILIYR